MRVLVAAALLLAAPAARGDQCSWMTREQAERAAAQLPKGAIVRDWCEPCGDPMPKSVDTVQEVEVRRAEKGYFELVVNGRWRDAAYLFVAKPGDRRARNVALLAGCPAVRVSATWRPKFKLPRYVP